MNDLDLFRQSGRRDLPAGLRRDHCVSVRLNQAELDVLDKVRGRHQRGEAVRLLAFMHLPAPIPPVNAELRADLGRALGNLATIATAMRGGDFVELSDLKALIVELRAKLLGAVK